MKKKKYIPHVIKEGAYFHVLSYDNLGVKCSEPNCEMNKLRDKKLSKIFDYELERI